MQRIFIQRKVCRFRQLFYTNIQPDQYDEQFIVPNFIYLLL